MACPFYLNGVYKTRHRYKLLFGGSRVGDTSVFISLQIVVTVYSLHLISVSDIAAENCSVKVCSILIVVVSPSV